MVALDFAHNAQKCIGNGANMIDYMDLYNFLVQKHGLTIANEIVDTIGDTLRAHSDIERLKMPYPERFKSAMETLDNVNFAA